ncbi:MULTISPECIES: glutamate racemase [Francisella]|uniref:Glutamate racemase n=1 Tax=Francisella opportunistica TaxID=2016517 RepID=A0A345JQT2_9GAMM|nr:MULTISPECIES: glutamate racemase [Francisella]APC91386.1 Glutamate racemase [Francisella sp. MA067296]AXH29678.1 glutamate racemase [Francisella opportunistica]AXH31328.1 glutamate racemase [Francisella opportunistica]AXH32974.1 glutamate racemase [Francisella opportunistica]
MLDNRPIGVFDSGIGGLTVVKNLMSILPNEDIIYFGDIARIPYGTKSRATIQKFAAQTAKFLIEQEVKAIIIACNTISAIAKDIVQEIAKAIPVIDVITAGVSLVDNLNAVGVIATPATINSNAYALQIHKKYPNIEVYSNPCGLFVSMIEEGFVNGQIVELVAKEYLDYFSDKDIQALILGCTHYPIIKESIAKILDVKLIDPSLQASKMLYSLLFENKLLNRANSNPQYRFYVTDIPLKFRSVGEMFLQTQMQHLEIVSLDSY